ncbi:uncharacterized protein LOC119084838 [Bradysia coprophila]|uniref:uncharacterized protein LOC119084838 n=1 Tax=Bradysia coprophila TaxID=38358 RepID=UPI00187DA79B|nr:uncharacterized protein LOC119084838 [Bradysia coprophila]
MGNTLCKERIERAENSKSPVDRVIGRCAQICPSSFGNNKSNSNYWKNNILETGPPTRHQPKATNPNEWRTVTLNTVPKSDPSIPGKLSDIPIAPPRKKRNTLQRNPGGFREVFGTPSRRSSCDSLEKFNRPNLNAKRRNSSDDFTDFSKDLPCERKISKVGNKKSDKFLGENLSDCLSNSPFLASTPILTKRVDSSSTNVPKDALETFVDSHVAQPDRSLNISKIVPEQAQQPNIAESKQSQPIQMHIQYSKEPEKRLPVLTAAKSAVDESVDNLDKRTEFLMTMVNHEFNNSNEPPLPSQPEEVLTVPKRRRSKNISNEDTVTVTSAISETSSQPKSEVIEQVVEILRNGQVGSGQDLKLDVTQKKKEFPKSNPDSPNIYAHLQPIEHELIVPVRKNYKCICDDEDHVHKHSHSRSHGHSHEHSDIADGRSSIPDGIIEHVKVEENKVQENVSPKKPERDFSRYRKSEDLSILEEPRDESLDSVIESQIIRPERKKGRSISRDSLPLPPPRPVKLIIDRKISLPEPNKAAKSRKISLQEPMRGLFENQKLPDTPVTPLNTPMLNDNEYEKIETFLKKCSSSQSFLTKELMDQLVDKVYGYSRNWDDQMEEGMLHTKCNDGSEKVGPSSKLTTRKISVIKKDSPPINIQENIAEVKKATFLIGTTDLQIEEPIALVKENAVVLQPADPITPNTSSLIKRTDTVLELLPNGAARVDQAETTDKTKNDSSPTSVPTTLTTVASNPDLEVVKVLLKSTEINRGSETNVLKDIYKKNQEIMDDFKDYLEDKKINEEMMKVANNTEVNVIIDEETDKSHSLFPDHVSVSSFDSANDSDTDTDDIAANNKRLAIADEPRRGSIVDHDQWFLKHRDLSNQGRRGSDCPTYDTTKLFPFGKREKTYSESSEFFFTDDQKKSKSSDHVNLDGADAFDHSTLLKYFNTTSPTTNLNKTQN